MELILFLALGLSLSLNLFLALSHKKPIVKKTQEAEELLAELCRGRALIKITVLDQDSIFLRSPR